MKYYSTNLPSIFLTSLPLRERGLKFGCSIEQDEEQEVAPLAGAWIEIGMNRDSRAGQHLVAPLAGAWIEIKFGNAINSL